MLSCSIWFSASSFWMGGGLESRCVGHVYSADGATWHHPHRKHDLRSSYGTALPFTAPPGNTSSTDLCAVMELPRYTCHSIRITQQPLKSQLIYMCHF